MLNKSWETITEGDATGLDMGMKVLGNLISAVYKGARYMVKYVSYGIGICIAHAFGTMEGCSRHLLV